MQSSPYHDLAATWRRSDELSYWFSRSAWSLVAIARLRQNISGVKKINIWIPDYFCNNALEQLRNLVDVTLIFYPINTELAPDIQKCCLLANETSVDLFIAVHYFSQPSPLDGIVTFCQERGSWLIEDAAHVLRPIAGVGEFGDFVLYSPYKYLPIPDGAVLVIRKNGPGKFGCNKETIKVFEKVSFEMIAQTEAKYASIKLSVIWLLNRVAQLIGVRRQRNNLIGGLFERLEDLKQNHPRMSSLSNHLLGPLLKQFDEIAERRLKNLEAWRDIFHLLSGVACKVSEIGFIAGAPYLAAFSCTKLKDASFIMQACQQSGIQLATWHDLPPEVVNDKESHPIAISMQINRFYLPVHQGITKNEILGLGKKILNLVVQSWAVKSVAYSEWIDYWARCGHANLLQSWAYGNAKEQSSVFSAKRFLIIDGLGNPVALCQVLIKAIPLIGGIARINSGPILLTKSMEKNEISLKLASLLALVISLRHEKIRIFSIAPNLPTNDLSILGLKILGFKKISKPEWSSGKIFLDVNEHSLFMSLSSRWRRTIRKGEKLGAIVAQLPCDDKSIAMLLRDYENFQRSRKFNSHSNALIKALAKQVEQNWSFNIFAGYDKNEIEISGVIGYLVTVYSGDTAIYLIGTNTGKGRAMQINATLIWHAILEARKAGCIWFDVGGLSEGTSDGISEFKLGLNSRLYTLVGEWLLW